MIKAVSQAISPVRVIPLEEENRIVLEIDITPSMSICGHNLFPIRIPTWRQDKGKINLEEKAYFVRDGPSSTKVPNFS